MFSTISFRHIAPLIIILAGIVASCKPDPSGTTAGSEPPAPSSPIRLQSLSPEETGIQFFNRIDEEGRINIFTWHFLYNGGGVAAGDINNDGLPDLYFTGNRSGDKLYLNKGDFVFEDITTAAGISPQLWSSGVTMADVNADGWLDIYVSRNSPTVIQDNNRNKLYINQHNGAFIEQAALYGIDDTGFGTQATFFDADQDGDLDVYVVNQPFDEFARLVNRPEAVAAYSATHRIYFFENGKYTDRTSALGMETQRYGLAATLADFDDNGWTDLYICNDYHHADHLYMNKGGIFTDELPSRAGHISFYSMGADISDINGDGWPDIFTLDMAFDDHVKSKTNMGSMNAGRFWSLVAEQHNYQYMQNVLQVNAGGGYFSDMAQLSGISKTDWSFAALFADLDHDALPDILITNGVLRDMQNNDFNVMVKERYRGMVGPNNYLDILHSIPSNPVLNIMYGNNGDMRFTKLPPEAGFNTPGFSHGMAYADLDGDGKLDVVINNMNATASVYKNVSASSGKYLAVKLRGYGKNYHALGSTVVVYAGGKKQVNTLQTTRGYFSSVEPMLHFGIGEISVVDSVRVVWNHAEMSVIKNIKPGQVITIEYDKEEKIPFVPEPMPGISCKAEAAGDFMHRETEFDDYAGQVLLPYKLSQNGPHIATGDVNGDGFDDFFIGGASGYEGKIFIQDANGVFDASVQPALAADKNAEDQEAALFDFDGDGDIDLLVVSGSNEFSENDPALGARLYVNDGRGHFSKADKATWPGPLINGQSVAVFDADGDGDTDVFIGGRLTGGQYAVPAPSLLLINQGGKFADETKSRAPFLTPFGMVTDAVSDDIDQDGDIDLIVVGEWMMPAVLRNDGRGRFKSETIDIAGTGLWWSVEKGDFDQDGDTDFVIGNLGWNNKFGGSRGTKLEVYSSDFDRNGDFDVVLATTKKDKLLPVRGRECSSQEMPFILDKFPTYESYANAALTDIYSKDMLSGSVHKKLSTMTSIYLQNDGSGKFSVKELPLACQAGPVKAFLADDFNDDGHPDFMYGGNHLPTEVETARYDGLYTGICFGNGKGDFNCKTLFTHSRPEIEDIRSLKKINVRGKRVFLVGRNNQSLRGFSLE